MAEDQPPATRADARELKDLIERVETNLVTEFHKWAQTYGSRGVVQQVHTFEERLMILGERVGNLERHRKPPAA
jgi:hypothetical protein